MNDRRGFSLVEMSAAISVGSVLMVLAMGVVHRTMRIESSMRENAAADRATARLARQLRHDIHQAESVVLDLTEQEKPVLRLELSGQASVTYRVEGARVLREQPRNESQMHRENFPFPEDFAIGFEELTSPERMALTVQQDTKLVGVLPRVELHVEAVVGRLLQLRQPQEESP